MTILVYDDFLMSQLLSLKLFDAAFHENQPQEGDMGGSYLSAENWLLLERAFQLVGLILALGAAIAGMMIVFTKQTSKQIWSGRAAILTLIAGLLGLLVFWAQTNKEIAAATPRSSFIPAEKLPPSGEQQGLIVVVTSSGETSDFSSKLMDVLSSRYKFITINNGISVGFPCDLVIFSNGQNASRLQNDLEKLNLKAIISDGFPPIPARIYADYRDYMVLVVPERR